jgi:transposase-like protein
MRKERKHYTEEKATVLRRHLLDKVPVSDLCEELSLKPLIFYRWQKEFFDNGAAAFQAHQRPHRQVEEVPHDVRDQVVDFVRRWSERTEIGVGRFISLAGCVGQQVL